MAEEVKKETTEEEKELKELSQEDLENVAGGLKPTKKIKKGSGTWD